MSPRKSKYPPLTFEEKMHRLKQSGLGDAALSLNQKDEVDDLDSLEERVNKILGIVRSTENKAGYMLFFVMYDIESNKVRREIVKYLEKNGCSRVQKSIFLANLPVSSYNKVKDDLAAVQASYENNDSILVVPISTDLLRSMKIIGQNINVDVITHSKNTLFF